MEMTVLVVRKTFLSTGFLEFTSELCFQHDLYENFPFAMY